jgi:single-strand DNA-binding protein
MELNKVMVIGCVVADPIMRMTNGGKAVGDIRIAVNRRLNADNQETAFVDVTVWDKAAEFAKNYLKKGSKVFIEGRLKEDTWEDKTSGAKRSKIGITAERIQFAETKSEAEARAGGGGEDGSQERQRATGYTSAPRRQAAPAQTPATVGAPEGEEDLPF